MPYSIRQMQRFRALNFVLVSPSFERLIVVWLSRTVSKADEQLMLRDKLTGVGGQHRTPSWTAGHPEFGIKNTCFSEVLK